MTDTPARRLSLEPHKKFEVRYISPKSAALYLELSVSTIYRLMKKKKLPFRKFGHSVRLDLWALDSEPGQPAGGAPGRKGGRP